MGGRRGKEGDPVTREGRAKGEEGKGKREKEGSQGGGGADPST